MFLNDQDLLTVATMIAEIGDNAELAKKVLDRINLRREAIEQVIMEQTTLHENLSNAYLAILETIPND